MSLRNQPYLPLYVDDFLSDEKLVFCSAATTGVYIRLMCLMHKSEEYGRILLKQKFKQNESNLKNFASQLAVQMPYDYQTILFALEELVCTKVLQEEPCAISQLRMVKDNEISEKRTLSGKKGGEKSLGKKQKKPPESTGTEDHFACNFAQANFQAKPGIEYGNENENENVDVDESEKEEKEESGENFSREAFFSVEALCEQLLANDGWVDVMYMQYRLKREAVERYLREFCGELRLKGIEEKSRPDFRHHFINWLKIQLEKNGKYKANSGNRDHITASLTADLARVDANFRAAQGAAGGAVR